VVLVQSERELHVDVAVWDVSRSNVVHTTFHVVQVTPLRFARSAEKEMCTGTRPIAIQSALTALMVTSYPVRSSVPVPNGHICALSLFLS
jgi:hypothetical protein